MLNYKKISWSLLFLIFSLTVSSQDKDTSDISYSISVGPNASVYGLSNFESNKAVTKTNNEYFGYNCSFSIDLPIYKPFFFITGLSYVFHKSEFYFQPFLNNIPINSGDLYEPYQNILSTYNFYLPLLLKISNRNSKKSFFGLFGINAIYNFHTSLIINNYIYNIYTEDFIFTTRKNTVYGLNYEIALGKNFLIAQKQFFVELQYMQDLTGWNYVFSPMFNYSGSNPTVLLKNYSLSFDIVWVF